MKLEYIRRLAAQTADKVVWSYGEKGVEISSVFAVAGTFLTGMVGGWDKLLQVLLLLMLVDYISGLLAAAKNKTMNSKIMFWGGINKIFVLLLVAVGVGLDGILPLSQPYIRTAIIWFYIGREGLSLLENYGKMSGDKAPSFLTELLAQLQNKGDSGKEKLHD